MPISGREWVGSKDAKRYPYVARCSNLRCHFTVSSTTLEKAEMALKGHEDTGPCPYRGGVKGSMAEPGSGKTLREQQWDKLDEFVDASEDETRDDLTRAQFRGAVQGLAWSIFLMDQPYWRSVKEIYNEAVKRYRIRQGVEEYSPTPGCDLPWSPSVITGRMASKNSSQSSGSAAKAAATVHPSDKEVWNLGEQKISGLVNAVRSGMFSAGELADIYGITVKAVNRVIAQPDRFAKPRG